MASPQALSPEATAALQDVPPSAKLVAMTLAYEGRLTQALLAAETRLPGRTIRHAVGILEERGIVGSRVSFVDARQRIYSLDPASRGATLENP